MAERTMTDPSERARLLAENFSQADALNGSLNDTLAYYESRSRQIVPEVLEAYDRMVARLATAVEGVPEVGEELPEFLLPDDSGHLVSSSALIERRAAVISINRGHWCPYCRLELRALSRAQPHLERSGVEIVSIVPESAAFASRMRSDHALPFRVLSDVDLAYSFGLGLVVWVGEEIIELYKRLGIDLPRFQGNDSWFLPIPATFVVGHDRRIRAVTSNPDFRRRMAIEQIQAALTAMGIDD